MTLYTPVRLGDIIDGVDSNRLQMLARTVDEGGQDGATREPFIARQTDGSLRTVDLQVNCWKTEDGEPRFTALIRDITEEKWASDALVEAEKRWDFALKSGHIAVYDRDLVSGQTIVSGTWMTLTGFDEDEEIDTHKEFLARVHPDDLPHLLAADAAAIDGETARTITEFRFLSKRGDTIWLRIDGIIADRSSDGKALRLLGTMVDITSHKLAAAALQASEERFRSTIQNAPVGMALVTPEGLITSVNSAMCSFLGYSEPQLLHRDFRKLMLETDTESIGFIIGQDHKKKTAYQGEHVFLHSDGDELWGLVNVSEAFLHDNEIEFQIVQILDINDRKEMDRMKNEFVATISHELRTPLTSIRGALGLFTGIFAEEIPFKARNLINIAHKNCDRLILLVNDFLDLEKLASQSYSFDMKSELIGTLVYQAVEANQTYADQFGVRLEYLGTQSNPRVWVDSARFQQVMSNILSNAAKFSPNGSIVRVTVEVDDHAARVCVADQGRGISPDFQAKIFKRFSQEDSSATRQKGGTGLGLHIAKQIIDGMNGTMGFESVADVGTVFWVELPISAVI